MSDDELLTLIANGNIIALEQLYKNTYQQVYAYIISMTKCCHIAEDLLHDTYMRILDKASSYQNGTSAKTWILTIAKNITYDYFRKTKNVISLDSSEDFTATESHDTSNDIAEYVALEGALKKLSTLSAQIAVLYAVCGYKHKEIATILSIPEGTVRRRYQEAIKQLANEMGGMVNE